MQTDTIPLILTYQVYGKDQKPLIPNTEGEVCIVLEPNDTIKCEKITLKIPIGDGPDRIFEASTAVLNPPDKLYWSVGKSQDTTDDQTNIDYVQWELLNKDPNRKVKHGANCSVTGMVNSQAGTAQVIIKENTQNTGDPDYEPRQGAFPIDKSGTPAFYLQNLIAIDPLNAGNPCCAIQQGYAVELRWDSNGTSFELYQSGHTIPIYSDKNTSYTLKDGISDTTTFTCVASDDNGNKIFESFTLAVISPILVPPAVITNTNEVIAGQMTAQKATCNTLDLHDNSITLTGTNPNVDNVIDNSSRIDVSGTFTVKDNGNTSNLIETLQCASITADNLTIQDSIDLTHQQLPIFGAFEQLASGTNIPVTTETANTDGYVIITVDVSTDDDTSAYGALSFDCNNWFSTYGANDSLDPVYGFLWLPVPAETTWYYKGENLTSVSHPATINIFWIPIGKSTPSAQQDSAALPVPDSSNDTNDPRRLFEQYTAAKKQRQGNIIASIETLLDIKFDVATKEEMHRQLTAL